MDDIATQTEQLLQTIEKLGHEIRKGVIQFHRKRHWYWRLYYSIADRFKKVKP